MEYTPSQFYAVLRIHEVDLNKFGLLPGSLMLNIQCNDEFALEGFQPFFISTKRGHLEEGVILLDVLPECVCNRFIIASKVRS